MGIRFIAMHKATDVFAEVMKPHKKWFENIYMSSLIEMRGSLYRIVCTISRFNKKSLRKILIATDQGKIVQSKNLTEDIISVFVYLHYFQVFAKNMAFDAQQSGDKNFGTVKTSLNSIYTELYSKLYDNEKGIMKEHLSYYSDTMHALDNLAELSKQCLVIVKDLEKMSVNDVLTETLREKLYQIIVKRGRLRGDIEALILKNGLKTRGLIKTILNDSKYAKHISDKTDKNSVITEANNADNISYSVIRKGETDWKFYEKWLEIDKGKFTIKKFISDLSNLNEAKLFIQTNINMIVKEHWIYSPNLKY